MDAFPIGISSCLLGNEVRFDGGHKRSDFLTDELGRYVRWVPVCPEVEIGLGIPRETLRLLHTDQPGHPMLVTNKSRRDLTETMTSYSAERMRGLKSERLRGFVLKKDSPSCGLERVKVYSPDGICTRDGRGLFASRLVADMPLLPVEEEGRLQDAKLRENFVTRIFTYDRWLRLRGTDSKTIDSTRVPGAVVRFHTEHKMLLLAHSPKHYQELGRLVAQAGQLDPVELLNLYEVGLMEGLRKLATRGRHVNVLEHLAGFLKEELSTADRDELTRTLDEYKKGWIPLITPLVLLRSHLKRIGHGWIEAQQYLDPYPRDLALRSHV